MLVVADNLDSDALPSRLSELVVNLAIDLFLRVGARFDRGLPQGGSVDSNDFSVQLARLSQLLNQVEHVLLVYK